MNDSQVKHLSKIAMNIEQLWEAKTLASNLGIKINDALERLGGLPVADIGRAQARQTSEEFIDLATVQIPCCVLEMIPEAMARQLHVLPLFRGEDAALILAIHNLLPVDVLDRLRITIGRNIRVVVAPQDAILAAIDKHYWYYNQMESVDIPFPL